MYFPRSSQPDVLEMDLKLANYQLHSGTLEEVVGKPNSLHACLRTELGH